MRTITGQLIDKETQQPLGKLDVSSSYRLRSTDKEVLAQSTTSDSTGTFVFEFSSELLGNVPENETIKVVFQVSDNGHRLPSTGGIAKLSDKDYKVLLKVTVPPAETVEYIVSGTVASRTRAGVGSLRVEVVDKNVGDDVTLAVSETDSKGAYRASFTDESLRQRGKTQPDLQARAYSGETFLGASAIRYNASNREILHVAVEETADKDLESEYETLAGSLRAHFQGDLGDLKETDEQKDVTYLANKSGWDARAVAMAALADQFSKDSATDDAERIPPELFYALFRAGFPANSKVYQAEPDRVLEAWKQCTEQGVIPVTMESRLPPALERFKQLSVDHKLASPALTGLSSLKELIALSLPSETEQEKFAELQVRHGRDREAFWEAAQTEFGEVKAKRLRLDGQLAFLTINNAPLVRKLHETAEVDLKDPAYLVEQGFHRAEAWEAIMGDDEIPAEVPGEALPERRTQYAEYLAAQLRLSYPTATLSQMVKAGDTPVTTGMGEQVSAFLGAHQGEFEIGVEPLGQYIERNNLEVEPTIVHEINRIERVRQITPGDQAMNLLLRKGLDSAMAVSRYPRDAFVRAFRDEIGGELDAKLTHAKAQQVHNAVLNIVMSAMVARTAPEIGGHSPARFIRSYPTMENLFGSMDFCTCEHCRSILSPAAYLVDLLQFLDPEDDVWTNTVVAPWHDEHRDDEEREAPYPFESFETWDAAGQPAGTEITPFKVLSSIRPDIEHLPLTCENTNTPVPYIDLVNEVLEYFIADDALSLDNYEGHTTADDTDPEVLLTTPQFVNQAAYDKLAETYFPTPLPFYQELENLRRYFNRFEAPLARVMEALRKSDDLETGDWPDYGWRDILMEEVGLSRREYEILTDRLSVPLWRLFGFASDAEESDVISALSNGKQFARRVGISYEDLITILRTRFINPNSVLIPKLERLGLSFGTIKAIADDTTMTDGAILALIPDSDRMDPSEFGDAGIRAWLTNSGNYDRIMGLVTLTIPAAAWSADSDYAVGDVVRPVLPPERSSLYYECRTAGASGPTEPDWPTTTGDTVTENDNDNDVKWICRDASNCSSFDNLAFRYSDPDQLTENVDPVVFVRLMRFIRLWRKLDWSIEQVDATICALYPVPADSSFADAVDSATALDDGFLVLLPRLGVIMRVIEALNLTPKRDLLPLLACFAPIDTHGMHSLYRRLFLSSALLKRDPTKPNPFAIDEYGNVMSDDSVKVFDEKEAVRAALGLTETEFGAIVEDLGFGENEPLSLETVSKVFRRAWLARTMKLSVRELLLLIERTGINPYAPPDPADETTGRVQAPMLQFLELLDRMKEASFKSEQALYLIWNDDLSGKSAPEDKEVLAFAQTLRTGLAAVESEFTVPDNPDEASIRTRMALVYGDEATNFFFGLLNNTLVTEAPYEHLDPSLEQSILDIAPGRLAYDAFHKRLTFSGLLTKTICDALKVGTPEPFEDAVDALFEANKEIIRPFFERFPKLRPLADAFLFFGELKSTVNYSQTDEELIPSILEVASGRLSYHHTRHKLTFKGVLTVEGRDALSAVTDAPSSFAAAVGSLYDENQTAIDDFFDANASLAPRRADYEQAGDELSKRWAVLLDAFLPILKQRRKDQQALQAISAVAQVDLNFAKNVLDHRQGGVYVLHAAEADDSPAVNDLTAIESPGLSVAFFFGPSAGGTADVTRATEANLAYATEADPLPVNPSGGLISGIWRGYLQPMEDGFYKLRVKASPGATVSFKLDDNTPAVSEADNEWSMDNPIELHAGVFVAVEIRAEGLQDKLHVRWEIEGRVIETIPPASLFSARLVDQLRATYVRFLKVASLAQAFNITASELAWLAGRTEDRIDDQSWLNGLPVTGSPDHGTSMKLHRALNSLLVFSRLKSELAPKDERLLAVFKDPDSAANDSDSLLFSLTRWDEGSLDALLSWFSMVIDGSPDRAALGDLNTFHRVHEAFIWIQKLKVSADALTGAATNAPTADTVRTLQAALRARHDEAAWLNVLKPINDEMRSLQRDALVAYILHKFRESDDRSHIDTPDKLFEYFLMDVQMDPCMQTSRVRHALSSIQLFVERCLMNLEPRVAPSVIDAKQWQWMKRYRVWEADRKIVLWPENWLEPELRDDQSPFFKETMSELLQSDITEERAATALGNYLAKLDEVAKLEPCGMYYEEPETGTEDEVVHVVARTSGANRKYYYRRLESCCWSPWEQIKVDIEDNPVLPVVWKGRLFLFWLRILKEPPTTAGTTGTDGNGEEDSIVDQTPSELEKRTRESAASYTRLVVKGVLCWSEYYNGKWQPTKTSDVSRPAILDYYSESTSETGQTASYDRNILRLEVIIGHKLRILVYESNPIENPFSYLGTFVLYNIHSTPDAYDESEGDVHHDSLVSHGNNKSVRATTLPRTEAPGMHHVLDVCYIPHWHPEDTTSDQGAISTRVLVNPLNAQVVEPAGIANQWNSPLLYTDKQHAFYITPSALLPTVSVGNGFTAPSLDAASDGVGQLLIEPIEETPRAGARHIRMRLGDEGSIRYGDSLIDEIGSSGPARRPPRL